MSIRQPRTSLAVGFDGGKLPVEYENLIGRLHREIPLSEQFPFEDRQFEAVMIDANAVSRVTVREAHRVMLPCGRLYMRLPEKTRRQNGFTLPETYAILREGYNIVGLQTSPWWRFWGGERVLHVIAEKKNWHSAKANYRPYV